MPIASLSAQRNSARGQGKKGSQERRLRKLLEQKKRLLEELQINRIPVSVACNRYVLFFNHHVLILCSIIEYCKNTKDHFVPSVWGSPPIDPFASQSSGACNCIVM